MFKKKQYYKKKAMPYFMLLPLLAVIAVFMLYPIFNTFWPVSYTHLDVYKRQEQEKKQDRL